MGGSPEIPRVSEPVYIAEIRSGGVDAQSDPTETRRSASAFRTARHRCQLQLYVNKRRIMTKMWCPRYVPIRSCISTASCEVTETSQLQRFGSPGGPVRIPIFCETGYVTMRDRLTCQMGAKLRH